MRHDLRLNRDLVLGIAVYEDTCGVAVFHTASQEAMGMDYYPVEDLVVQLKLNPEDFPSRCAIARAAISPQNYYEVFSERQDCREKAINVLSEAFEPKGWVIDLDRVLNHFGSTENNIEGALYTRVGSKVSARGGYDAMWLALAIAIYSADKQELLVRTA